jgi:hypothetical protein
MTGRTLNSPGLAGVSSREIVESAIERSKGGRNITWQNTGKRSPARQRKSGPKVVERQPVNPKSPKPK